MKIPKGKSESVNRRTDNTMAKRKVQKDKQRSTKHTHKTKDRVTRTPINTGGELGCVPKEKIIITGQRHEMMPIYKNL